MNNERENPKEEREKGREPEESDGFKVSDRRQFTPEGQVRTEAQPPPEEESAKASQAPPDPREEPVAGKSSQEAPKLDFSSFLFSLATSGMVHLGEVPDPATGQKVDNLEGAQQMIEILTILQEKTKGNLTPEENHILDSFLYELRMKFLAKSKVIKL